MALGGTVDEDGTSAVCLDSRGEEETPLRKTQIFSTVWIDTFAVKDAHVHQILQLHFIAIHSQ